MDKSKDENIMEYDSKHSYIALLKWPTYHQRKNVYHKQEKLMDSSEDSIQGYTREWATN